MPEHVADDAVEPTAEDMADEARWIEKVRLADRQKDLDTLDVLVDFARGMVYACGQRVDGHGAEKHDDTTNRLIVAARDRAILAALGAIERAGDDLFPATTPGDADGSH